MFKKIAKTFKERKQVIAYLFWGIMTTIVNLIIFQILVVEFSALNYEISNGIAWLISALFAYFTNRKWVFHSATHNLSGECKEIISFMAGRFGSLIVEDIILWIGITLLGFNNLVGKASVKIVGEIFVIVFNYFWSKLAVFKNVKHPSN